VEAYNALPKRERGREGDKLALGGLTLQKNIRYFLAKRLIIEVHLGQNSCQVRLCIWLFVSSATRGYLTKNTEE
jgi:hypothetical protein